MVGQTPLFIELSLLKGVCAFFCGWGSWEVGRGGECKELSVQRRPMGGLWGTQRGQAKSTRMSESIAKSSHLYSSLSTL